MRIDDYAPCPRCGTVDVMRDDSPYCLRCGDDAATWAQAIRSDLRLRALWDRVQALEAAKAMRRALASEASPGPRVEGGGERA